jgi:two-component system chemotaxis sensor kinase CheA
MAVDMSQFHRVFFEESVEGLQVMEGSLLDLDCANPDPEAINAIFRAAHSLKGSSSTFGFTVVAEFTHLLETLLDQWRDASRPVIQAHVDVLLQSVDVLRQWLTDLQSGRAADASVGESVSTAISAILAIAPGQVTAAPAAAPASVASSGLKRWRIAFRPAPQMLTTGNEPLRMFRELAELGTLTATPSLSRLPDFASLEPETCYVDWDLELVTAEEESRIRDVFEWVVDDCSISIECDAPTSAEGADASAASAVVVQQAVTTQSEAREPVAKAAAPVAAPLPAAASTPVAASTSSAAATSAASATSAVASASVAAAAPVSGGSHPESSSVRVSIEKIDSLVNLVGELVITQSMLGQLTSDFDMSRLARLQEGLTQLEHNTRELQESVMRIRMLPINFTFSRFPRMVRDLSRQLGKKVDLRISGEQTELDKTVMEKIGDPLVHLIRNSLDHGLEQPEDRLAAGKSETGHITLNAYHQSGSIMIEISDDGRGLNTEKIRAKAIAQGLVREADTLSEADIQEIIFMPGFSTADKLSDVSGRGVGMDVVRRNIEGLGGSIDVFSRAGQGTRFLIRLPLTLAILDGQLIQVGEQIYIIPLTSIIESLQPDIRLVSRVAGGCDLYRLRNEYIPIIRLHEVFGIDPASTDLAKSLLVVVEAGAEKVAIVVDDLHGQQQVVIKSMEANYQKVEGVSGATILGDGTVSLILEITDLVRMAGVQHQSKISSKRFRNRDRVA